MFLTNLAFASAILFSPLLPVHRIPVSANTINGSGITTGHPDTTACPKTEEIEKIISEAISLGAPLYNDGMHLACYRIYEWAGYKILYEYGELCPDTRKILKATIDKSHGDFSDTEKAWLMRAAFDKILGVPTRTAPLKKSEAPL